MTSRKRNSDDMKIVDLVNNKKDQDGLEARYINDCVGKLHELGLAGSCAQQCSQ